VARRIGRALAGHHELAACVKPIRRSVKHDAAGSGRTNRRATGQVTDAPPIVTSASVMTMFSSFVPPPPNAEDSPTISSTAPNIARIQKIGCALDAAPSEAGSSSRRERRQRSAHDSGDKEQDPSDAGG
jgi:hypothetical protein